MGCDMGLTQVPAGCCQGILQCCQASAGQMGVFAQVSTKLLAAALSVEQPQQMTTHVVKCSAISQLIAGVWQILLQYFLAGARIGFAAEQTGIDVVQYPGILIRLTADHDAVGA